MDAFQRLKSDHSKADKIMDKLCETPPGAKKERENLFEKLKQELEIHARIEEHHLYPPLKTPTETKALVKDSLQEHDEVKRMLKELHSMDKSDPRWIEKLKRLKDDIEHHVSDEEKELFPKARQVLSRDVLEEMGKQLQQERDQLIKQKKKH